MANWLSNLPGGTVVHDFVFIFAILALIFAWNRVIDD